MQNSIYKNLITTYSAKILQQKTKLNLLAWLRLGFFILLAFSIYQCVIQQNAFWIISAAISLVLFIVAIRWYNKQQYEKKFVTALADINSTEDAFLQTQISTFSTGKEFISENHPYDFDLDIFAEGGLYAHINRCNTEFGKIKLAETLTQPNLEAIYPRQEAIAELKDKMHFRQNIAAAGKIHSSKNKDLHLLLDWLKSSATPLSIFYKIIIWITPVICIGSYFIYLNNDNPLVYKIFIASLISNLILMGTLSKRITKYIQLSNAANKLLQQYSIQIEFIENEKFESGYLKNLQAHFLNNNLPASSLLKKMVYLLNQLEGILNIFVSILLNGFLLYHLRILISLEKWKNENASFVTKWLETVGSFEELNSYANFSYNNPQFCNPKVSNETTLVAKNLGHPLIATSKRINNDIDFSAQRFTILTGSNMSGKSTFLRTVGVNLVLAKAGAPVCASDFLFYPFDIFVSMRINDSLQESESLFYAELKRLQTIVAHLQKESKTFVILDEILRGTNSNDKRNGTISFIKNLIQYQPYGMIATHDTIVAELKNELPALINNKCFESQIINDQLYFDYKIKDGVCTTLSASFLMKKMGIIK